MRARTTTPRPAEAHNIDHTNAVSFFTIATAIIAIYPGAALGALVASAIWRATETDILTKWLVGALGAATVGVLHSAVANRSRSVTGRSWGGWVGTAW